MSQDVALITDITSLPKPAKPEKHNYKLSEEDWNTAFEFRLKGLTYQEIADHFNITKQAVWDKLSPLIEEKLDTALYKRNRADIFANIQARIINNLTEDKLQKASAYQLGGMLGLIHEHERLERGQSTANVQQLSILVDKITKQSTGSDPIVPASIPQDVVIDATHNEPISK